MHSDSCVVQFIFLQTFAFSILKKKKALRFWAFQFDNKNYDSQYRIKINKLFTDSLNHHSTQDYVPQTEFLIDKTSPL